MLFSSITFLYVFLPVVLVAYYLAPRKAKNAVLLLASLLFYFFGEPVYVLLLVFSSVSDWLHSLLIEAHRGTRTAKIALISSIVINLGLLGFFKYTDFVLTGLNSVLGTALPLPHIALPLGISFFTFQTMSYTIDVYRGRTHAQKNLVTLATFVCLFPQLVAGPIVRYTDIASALESRRETLDAVSAGVRRFVFGLGKKVLLANAMGELCAVFRASDEKTVVFYWLYAIAFMLQIYFDFSGYSDMAIGLGAMFGFHFPENFDYPYIARSITEFWRRWHKTLGGWFRDYVYIPLGGNRTDKRWKWMRNIAVVWLLTGLWHGAAWNFVAWGALFGAILMVEKLWLAPKLAQSPPWVQHVYVLGIVLFSFVLFNANGFDGAVADVSGLLGLGGVPFVGATTLYYAKSYALLLALCILGATPYPKKLYLHVRHTPWLTILEPASLIVLLLVVSAYLVDGSFNPFLYFRF